MSLTLYYHSEYNKPNISLNKYLYFLVKKYYNMSNLFFFIKTYYYNKKNKQF